MKETLFTFEDLRVWKFLFSTLQFQTVADLGRALESRPAAVRCATKRLQKANAIRALETAAGMSYGLVRAEIGAMPGCRRIAEVLIRSGHRHVRLGGGLVWSHDFDQAEKEAALGCVAPTVDEFLTP